MGEGEAEDSEAVPGTDHEEDLDASDDGVTEEEMELMAGLAW